MLSHTQIWAAIDTLAQRHGLSTSALARRAGLDPTTFNPSKRTGPDGRPRWPSTESIAKALEATGDTLDAFMDIVSQAGRETRAARARTIPLIGLAQAGTGGYFDDSGLPRGEGWEEVAWPGGEEHYYALEIAGDSMLPLYRDGDTIIVAPGARLRRGDRVVVRTVDGEVMAKELKRETARTVELRSLNPDHQDRVLERSQIASIARIVWASQ